MAQYQVQLTEENVVTIDAGPGMLPMTGLTLRWRVDRPEDLTKAVDDLGFDVAELDPTEVYHYRYVPLTQDGERVASHVSICLELGIELAGDSRKIVKPQIAALADLVDAAQKARDKATDRKAQQAAVDWARENGRDVHLVDGEIVEVSADGSPR
jgi:hypothetical protein